LPGIVRAQPRGCKRTATALQLKPVATRWKGYCGGNNIHYVAACPQVMVGVLDLFSERRSPPLHYWIIARLSKSENELAVVYLRLNNGPPTLCSQIDHDVSNRPRAAGEDEPWLRHLGGFW
jgi:hypothetical protein